MVRIGMVALGLVTAGGVAFAQAPSLTGTWTGSGEGIGAEEGRGPQAVTVEVTEQQGATFTGRVAYGEGEGEPIVGTVAPDGRTVHRAGDDGHATGALTAADTMEVCYIEVGADAEASCVVLTRAP
jgi:hypothetical protein